MENNTETAVVPAASQVPAKKEKPISELSAKELFETDKVKAKFQDMLGKRSTSFITSVLQIVASNKLLAKADPMSIYQSAAVAATLDLPLNNNLGFAYIVPYNQWIKNSEGQDVQVQVAQFQMGWKGYVQLAQRSGQYRKIAVTEIYEGQLIEENPLTGFVFDFKKKTSNVVIGFAAYFELLNGFEKTAFATTDELKAHGVRYSQTYKKNFGLWVDDFNSMAKKTILKLLISKFGPLSVDIQRAVIVDQSVVNDAETNDVTYVDHEIIEQPKIDPVVQRIELLIENADTPATLESYLENCNTEELQTLYKNKLNQLLDADLDQQLKEKSQKTKKGKAA